MGKSDRLELTEDEAYALLSLCMTSGLTLDAQSENVLKKLAQFCKKQSEANRNYHSQPISELCEAG